MVVVFAGSINLSLVIDIFGLAKPFYMPLYYRVLLTNDHSGFHYAVHRI